MSTLEAQLSLQRTATASVGVREMPAVRYAQTEIAGRQLDEQRLELANARAQIDTRTDRTLID